MSKNNGVIIDVYLESKVLRSDIHRGDPIKKINPKTSSSHTRVFKTRGYDRRAQLLAYAKELRNANAQQQLPWSFKNSKLKKLAFVVAKLEQKWRWSLALQKMKVFFSRFCGIKRRWKYEAVFGEEEEEEEYSDVEGSCNREETRRRKRKTCSGRRRNLRFCNKLKRFFKMAISRAWKCRNGGT